MDHYITVSVRIKAEEVKGGLAFHRTIGEEGGYTITHVRSGMSMKTVKSKAGAKRLLNALVELGVNWEATQTTEDFTQEERSAIRTILRNAW